MVTFRKQTCKEEGCEELGSGKGGKDLEGRADTTHYPWSLLTKNPSSLLINVDSYFDLKYSFEDKKFSLRDSGSFSYL